MKKSVNTAVILTLATSVIVMLLAKSRRLINDGFLNPMEPVISPASYAHLRLTRMRDR